MKMNKKILAFATTLFGITAWAGDSAPFLLDTTDLLITALITYNSSWNGGNSSAEVVIAADGMEIKRTTGKGEFAWSPTTSGKHTLTYTTYINGVAQDEVYTATVYADWKYTVEDGKATIVDTAQKSGNVTIPSEIDGLPVVGLGDGLFAGCHGLFITVPPSFMNGMSAVKSFEQNEWVRDDSESGEVYKSNDIDHNGSTYMIATVKGPCEFSFDWKVSSESGYDWLRWYLDGSQEAEISGETSWQTVTYSLPEGEHTIKWGYSKDGSVDNGSDCGWVRMNENMTKMDFGDATYIYSDFPCSWGGDANWKNDNDGSLRSGKITHGQSTWMEMKAPGQGLLTYRWKASCEYWVDEIFDYGYLSVDGAAKGRLIDDDYSLEGIAIGGQTDWQEVEVDIEGEGDHILRWTFTKDAIDEGDVGEDCIWVSDLKFRPLTTLSFNIGAANGSVPLSVTELSETVIKLPEYGEFDRPLHMFTGWSDGVNVYAPGGDFEMRATNVTLTAVYRANTIAMPVVNSRDVVAGGVHNKASATIKISADSGTTIYYTLDGSVPTSKSRRYDEPFAVDTLGTVTVKAIALRDNYFDSPVATFSFTRSPYSAAECLNISGWKVNLTGNAEWFRVLGEAAHDGDAALRSGAIGDNQSSAVEVKVAGEGSLSFWWKSSSETSRGRKRDYVSFQIDGAEYAWLGGSNDWTNVVCNITGTGEHTLKWEYIKNEEALQGEDCAWLDEVVLTSFQVPKSSITYENLKGATHTNPEKYQDGSVVEFTNPSAVEGYTFAGWTPERITADMSGAQIVRANWTANNYTIAYNANGGTGTMEVTLATYDSEVILKDNKFVRNGYIFKGWALEEGGDVVYAPGQSVMNLTAQLDGVVTLYAVWDRILIAVDEPVAVDNLIYNGSEQVGVVAAKGYTLSGVIAATDAGEYTATATLADGYKWADGSMDEKTVTWSIAKAANEWITEPKISIESWTEGETAGELTDGVAKFGAVVVTMGGAEFTVLPTAPGSYTIEYSVAETGNYSGLTKALTFEIIKYVPIISEITYENLRGATHTNPETYQERSVVEFTDPSEVEGYTFAGWTPERITADMTGAQMIRANWTANNYTIAYNSNGGNGTMESTLATYDSEAIVKNNEFIRDGYTFKGWALEEGGDVAYAPGQNVMNLTAQAGGVVTLYAKWVNSHNFVIDGNGVLTKVILGNDTVVVIPEGVTSIGDFAFSDCSSLTSVTIPDSVTSIGEGAFWGCSSLTSVIIPDSVTSIGDWAFSGCSSLTSVTIPDSVTSIGYWAFEGCEGLADDNGFVIVKGVLYDYYGEGGVVVIPNGVTRIGDDAFLGCDSLTSVIIPDSVTSIGYCAFAECSSLMSVTIPDSVTSIGDDAFLGCDSLTSVTIPDSVTSIGYSAFYACSSLTSVTIPDSVTSIGDWAFYECSSLTSITIPDSVTSIGAGAFEGCEGLADDNGFVIVKGVLYDYYGEGGVVVIPDSVTSIGDSAFFACESLTSITIPNSVTSIGDNAFGDCDSLVKVEIPVALREQVEIRDVFYGCQSDLEIRYYCYAIFDGNTGDNTDEISSRVIIGEPIGELPTPTREGYEFLGWFTAQEGGDEVTSETIITTDMTIYAHWERPNPIPAINPDWGYVVTELGEKKNEVAVVFTNHTEKAMTWTAPVDLENVRFLVVGGGGGGGSAGTGGGGGAGGGGVVTGMIHKLEMDSTISVAVGSGGAGGTRNSAGGLLASAQGGNSTLTIGSVGAITAYGGAKVHKDSEYSGGSGNGSYGAGKAGTATKGKVDLSVEELVYSVESFGNNGGYGYNNKIGGGGGGAYPGDEGRGGSATSSVAGKGGAGLVSDITGEPITYGSGGGGSTSTVGASGGEGAGNGCSNKSAKANQGGGGGGAGKYSSGGKGGSGIVVIRYTIPSYLLPEDAEVFPEVTEDSKVSVALEGSADAKLAENITDAATYMAFREWALNLEGVTPEEVKASPNAWLSYALNTDKLIIAAPKEGDVVIDTFEIAATEGVFEFTVKIDGITVGENALEANLRKVFEVEGAETLASGGAGFSSDSVEVNTAMPENGNAKFTVTPKAGNGQSPNSFFFRVKMK